VAQRPGIQVRLPQGKKLKVLGRLSDAEKDIEVWELEDTIDFKPEFGALEGKDGKISEIKLLREDLYAENTHYTLIGPWQGVLSTKIKDFKLQTKQNENVGTGFWRQDSLGEGKNHKVFRLPSGDIISPAEAKAYDAYPTASRSELEARAKIQPGLSGAPFVQIRDPFIVLGMATSFEQNRMRSFFAKSEDITEVLEKYIRGERGHIGETRFQFSGPISYRDYGNGTLEANILRRRAGGGDGIRTDGGGGDGIRTDGGSRGRKLRLGSHEYIPQAGMIYKDHPVLAFQLVDTKSKDYPRQRLYYADKESYELFRDIAAKNQYSFKPLGMHEIDFLQIAQTRLRLDPEENELRFLPTLSYQARCGKALAKDFDGVHILVNHLEIHYTSCLGEKIKLQINRNGLVNGKKFLPQVEAISQPSGKKFIVDLRRLYFDNPRKWNQGGEDATINDYREVAIVVIDPSTGLETYFEFDRESAKPLPQFLPQSARPSPASAEKAN
jgi:hypothetical protein